MIVDGLTSQLRREMYTEMVLIRKFEEKLIALAREKERVVGMQILSYGQEAVAVGIVKALNRNDVIISNHRSHGHLLAKGADPKFLMAEIMCKATGVNKGKAGTLHLAVPEVNAIMTSTVVGASPPLGVGSAFAQQYRNSPDITVVFFGDGAAAEGSVHEAMNLAALWKLPVLFVCENNCWAGAQCLMEHSCVEDIVRRADAYGMPGKAVDGNDVDAVFESARKMAAYCREGKGPALIEACTYRMRGHGEHDPCHYMDPAELEKWAIKCPVKSFKNRLAAEGVLTSSDFAVIDADQTAIVEEAVKFGDDSPFPLAEDALKDLWIK
jgi:acetoin:2,6-dichlorophenolindophenol oxidoreductase subunit alpha